MSNDKAKKITGWVAYLAAIANWIATSFQDFPEKEQFFSKQPVEVKFEPAETNGSESKSKSGQDSSKQSDGE